MAEEDIKFLESTLGVATTDGAIKTVPCLTHPKAPGLCVTMLNIGMFNVTHVNSGMNISGNYERMYNAALSMASIQDVANRNGFSWDCSAEEVKESANKLTGKERTEFAIMRSCGFDEFPFEEKHPCNEASDILMGVEQDAST